MSDLSHLDFSKDKVIQNFKVKEMNYFERRERHGEDNKENTRKHYSMKNKEKGTRNKMEKGAIKTKKTKLIKKN